jgi:FecR-like protein
VSDPHEPQASAALEHLLDLARRTLTGDPPKRPASALQQLERRAARDRRRRRTFAGLGALAVAATVLIAVLLQPSPALKLEVINGSVDASGEVAGTPLGTRLQFSDGTQIELDPLARAHVGALDAHGAEVGLDDGAVTVRVVRRAGARWGIRAGDYRVSVTGTTFSVDFARERAELTVDLMVGSVSVSGPLIEGGLQLQAGQRIVIHPREGLVQVQPREARPAPAPRVAEAAAAPAEQAPAVARDGGVSPELRTRPAHGRAVERAAPQPRAPLAEPWSRLVAAGHYQAVLAAAEQRELARVYEEANVDDLQALADAARYVRRVNVARPALLGLRNRFAATPASHEAAFLLGRLEETAGDLHAALAWYERYLRESADGSYAAQALGRKLLIVRDQAGPAAAASVALEYVRRFPEGPYAATARALLARR